MSGNEYSVGTAPGQILSDILLQPKAFSVIVIAFTRKIAYACNFPKVSFKVCTCSKSCIYRVLYCWHGTRMSVLLSHVRG